MLKFPTSENRMKNRLKNNFFDVIAEQMWHLIHYNWTQWNTMPGELSQDQPKPKMVAELKEMLQVTAIA